MTCQNLGIAVDSTLYSIYDKNNSDMTLARLEKMFDNEDCHVKKLEIAALLISYKFREVAVCWQDGKPYFIRLMKE